MSDDTLVFDSKLLRRGFTKIPNALWEDENLSTGAKLTMGCILSFAWRRDPFPGQERLAKMVGCTDRSLRTYIGELKSEGYLLVRRRGLGKTNVYTIVASRFETGEAPEANLAAQSRSEDSSVHELSSASYKEDEVEEDEVNTLAAAPQNGHRPKPTKEQRDEVWDALTDIFGPALTRTAEQHRGKLVASLAEAGATRDEIFARAKRWPLHFENATLTAAALEKHWDTLNRKPLRRTG